MVTHPKTFTRIVRNPEILDGEPTVAGTRVAVRAVVLMHRLYRNVAGVQRALPHLSRADIEESLHYYESHRAEMNRDISQNDVDEELLFREDRSPW
ncbi:MAG: DUF433 domain-containing protein [Thermomicrobiales bacterium]